MKITVQINTVSTSFLNGLKFGIVISANEMYLSNIVSIKFDTIYIASVSGTPANNTQNRSWWEVKISKRSLKKFWGSNEVRLLK